MGEDGVVGALGTQGSIGQLGGEAGVAAIQRGPAELGGKHQVGVGVITADRAQDSEGHGASRIGSAAALGGSLLAVLAALSAVGPAPGSSLTAVALTPLGVAAAAV